MADDDLIRFSEAQERLGISKSKMARIAKRGLFPIYSNPLDRREKLVRWSEVESSLQPSRQPEANEPAGD